MLQLKSGRAGRNIAAIRWLEDQAHGLVVHPTMQGGKKLYAGMRTVPLEVALVDLGTAAKVSQS